jgi:hypothetical protein
MYTYAHMSVVTENMWIHQNLVIIYYGYSTLSYYKTNKLRGPKSASELYRLIDRHLSMKFSVNFCG